MISNICLITPNIRLGGMERVLSLIANYGVENGYKINVICLKDREISYYLDDRIVIYSPKYLYKKGILNKMKTFRFLYKTIKYIKPDTVLCFSEVFNPLSIIICKMTNTPVFISDRSNPYKVLRKSIRILRSITYPHADGMIAQTELAKKVALVKKFNENITVIPNPLRNINDTYYKEYNKRIISVGRLVSTKKFDELIRIFYAIKNAEDWELLILGEGPEEKKLRSLIKKLDIGHKVKLIGAVKDVDKYFAKASVFAFTSISEGFPNALSEAVAFPLACIAYDCPSGPSDIIQDGKNGFLIPCKDKILFEKYLEKLILSTELRNKFTQDYILYRHKLNAENICNKYINFICS